MNTSEEFPENLSRLHENECMSDLEPDLENGKEIDYTENSFTISNNDVSFDTEKHNLKEVNDEKLSQISGESNEAVVLETFDITPDKSSGVMKQIMQAGEGEEHPGYGDRVLVHYTGWLLNNKEKPTIFDSSRKRSKCEFALGKGNVIKGWDLGISTMKQGEISLFICQPEYAYGDLGSPPVIPPHATLLFEVELFGWKLEDLTPKRDGGVLRKVLKRGDGTIFPNEGSQVKVKIIGSFEENVFEDKEVDFVLGEGCTVNIPEGIELALLKFKLNEKSLLYIKDKYAYTTVLTPLDQNKVADEILKYEVTLLSFVKAKDVWEMNSDEKFDAAVSAKEKGLSYFKVANYKVALKQFKNITTYLEDEPGVSLDDKEPREAILLSAYLNIALCNLKLNMSLEAIKACDKALGIDPVNEKALFRRGQAKISINDCQEALEDFEKLYLINPDNRAAKNCITICQDKVKKQKLKDKSIYDNMFEKFVKQDEEKLRNMKTETGTWDEEARKAKDLFTIDSRKLLENDDSVLSNIKLIELSGCD